MQFDFFQIPSQTPAVAAEELNKFLNSHRIVNVEKHFHANGGEAYWSFCVTWVEQRKPQLSDRSTSKVDYREVLNTSQFTVFSDLRQLRKKLAEEDGVPVYAVATNQQLAEMVQQKVFSITELQKIGGFGKSKVDRYGEALLNLLKSHRTDASSTTEIAESTDAESDAS